MQQLIEQLTTQYGVSAEQATGIIDTVKNYLAANATAATAPADATEENMFQKATHFVEDHVPGGMKEKAEEVLGGLGDKLKGLFK